MFCIEDARMLKKKKAKLRWEMTVFFLNYLNTRHGLSWVDAWIITRVNSIKEYLDETNQPVSFINSLRRHLISSQTMPFCLIHSILGSLRNVNCNAVSRSFKNP
jgi:hypothetical protein